MDELPEPMQEPARDELGFTDKQRTVYENILRTCGIELRGTGVAWRFTGHHWIVELSQTQQFMHILQTLQPAFVYTSSFYHTLGDTHTISILIEPNTLISSPGATYEPGMHAIFIQAGEKTPYGNKVPFSL